MQIVLRTAKSTGRRNLILGAWGCGAYGNPPTAVANLFMETIGLSEFRGLFDMVIFAIVDPKKEGNYAVFDQAVRGLVDSDERREAGRRAGQQLTVKAPPPPKTTGAPAGYNSAGNYNLGAAPKRCGVQPIGQMVSGQPTLSPTMKHDIFDIYELHTYMHTYMPLYNESVRFFTGFEAGACQTSRNRAWSAGETSGS